MWFLGLLAAPPTSFHNYLYIDSEHHLIDNGIITSARDTFNAVELAYVKDAPKRLPQPGLRPQ